MVVGRVRNKGEYATHMKSCCPPGLYGNKDGNSQINVVLIKLKSQHNPGMAARVVQD